MSLKFKREKRTGLMDATEVWFMEVSEGEDQADPFSMVATGAGVRMVGRSRLFHTQDDLQSWAKTVDAVWREHLSLRSSLQDKLKGAL